MRYYLLLACKALVALLFVALVLRILGIALKNRRKYMLVDMGKAMRFSAVSGKAAMVVAAFAVAVAVLLMQVESGYQSGSVQIALTYPEASEGLNPNGSRYNMSDILSDEVLEQAIKVGGFSGVTADMLKETLSVEPIGRSDDAGEIVSTHFELAYNAKKDTIGYAGKEIVNAVAAAYRSWFIDKYAINYQALNVSFDDAQLYDYPDMQNYYSGAVQAIANFNGNYYMKDPSFYSEKTGESFGSLNTKSWDVYNTVIDGLNAYVLMNGLSRDHDAYLSRTRYNYTIGSKYYRQVMQAYDTRIAAIDKYDNDMATVVYIPTYDVNNVFYMSKTRIGIDYFSEEADMYSAEASAALKNLLNSNFLINQLRESGDDSAALANVDLLVSSLKRDILELADVTKKTAQDFEKSTYNGYISTAQPQDSFKPYVVALCAGMMCLILLYISNAMVGYKKSAAAKKDGGAA